MLTLYPSRYKREGTMAYCFFEKKPAIDVEFINDGQLSLF